MKKYIFIPENLLLLWVGILPVFAAWFYAGSILDVHLHDKYGMEPILYRIYWMIGVGTFTSYVFHLLLRKAKKRQKLVCNIHICITVLFATYLVFFDFYGHVPIKAFAGGLIHNRMVLYFSIEHNIFLQIFIGMQVAFVGFSCVRLSRGPKSQSR
jgi:hypothetical protein